MRSDITRKCLVWDLDHTLWKGVLLESDDVMLKDGVSEVLAELDRRGILHSIASRSDESRALARLESFGLRQYFLVPQIGWERKSLYVGRIAEHLNLAAKDFAFIDDDPFERDEVAGVHPGILCFVPEQIPALLQEAAFSPASISAEAANRRAKYVAEELRRADGERFEGSTAEFLASLGLHLTIAPVTETELGRAEELTVRTHQINSTGIVYSRDQLAAMAMSNRYRILGARLVDRYGDYGTVGLAIVELGAQEWTIRLLLVSCRVISRGVGAELLRFMIESAAAARVQLSADFVPNDVNRMTHIALRLAGFERRNDSEPHRLFQNGRPAGPTPTYLSRTVSFGEFT